MSRYSGTTLIFLVFILIATANSKSKNAWANNYVNGFLAAQNDARLSLGMPPLEWDPDLTAFAQSYADQRRSDCALKHSNGPYGENIFWGSGGDWTPYQAVLAWLSEKKWYNHLSNTCSSGEDCGHYTQVVWCGTKRVGCARVACDDGKGVFMTCNYDPPGNFIGEKPY